MNKYIFHDKLSQMESAPISVQILTWNSEKTLEKTLDGLQYCKEVLVIDGGSTDKTIEIAQKFGAKVIPQRPESEQGTPITDFAKIRNEALRHSAQPWILVLDSDEYVSEELILEVTDIACHEKTPGAYWVPRRYVTDDGHVIAHASTYPNARIYFFHRDVVQGWIKPVHERVELKDNIHMGHLCGASFAPLPSIEEYKRKNLRYLAIEKEVSRNKGWGHWFKARLLHTIRSRLIVTLKLLWIWLIPRKSRRLPLRYEMLRFWYGAKLIIETCPLRNR